ncbi:MAG: cytochrome b562 [Phycisphaerales bacterium]
MTKKLIASCLAAGLSFACVTAAVAQDSPPPSGKPAGQDTSPKGPPPGGEGRGRGGERGTGRGGPGAGAVNLEGAMKSMGRALKSLQSTIGDASKKEENLKLIFEMERACAGAKGAQLPPDITKNAADDAAKAKMTADFRADLNKLLRALLDLEQSVTDGNTAQATSQLATIAQLRDASHKQLGVKD